MKDTILHYASYKENIELIDYLLANKADVHFKNSVKF